MRLISKKQIQKMVKKSKKFLFFAFSEFFLPSHENSPKNKMITINGLWVEKT